MAGIQHNSHLRFRHTLLIELHPVRWRGLIQCAGNNQGRHPDVAEPRIIVHGERGVAGERIPHRRAAGHDFTERRKAIRITLLVTAET